MRREAKLARDFAAALEGRGAGSARRDPALAPLLRLAQGLDAVPLAPSPDFRDALRSRLLAVATVRPVPAPAPAPLDRVRTWVEGWRVQKAIAATSAAMAGVVALTGVSVAASRSLPGDPLYGAKRSVEGLQLTLARNDVNRGKRHLQHAETRLHEIARVLGTDIALAPAPSGPGQITLAFGGSRSARVADALRAMDADTRAGTDLLFDAYFRERDDDVLRVVQQFTDRQRSHLDQVMVSLPAGASDAAQQSLSLISGVGMRASQLLGTGTEATSPLASGPAPDANATPLPTTAPTPSPTATGSEQCYCDAPPPPPTSQPTPMPTESESPDGDVTESPAPPSTPPPSHYPLPSQVPSPIASLIQPIVDQAQSAAPTPLPTVPPVPSAAPPDPGAS